MRVKFNPEVNLGHLLLGLTWIIGACVFAVRGEMRIAALEKSDAQKAEMIEKIADAQQDTAQALAGIRAIIEQRRQQRPPQQPPPQP